MVSKKKEITVIAVKNKKEFFFKTYEGEYRNLMELFKDNLNLEEFGDCRGLGRCGTCTILVEDKILQEKDRNEETTLKKINVSNVKIRLSCQILIDDNLEGIQFELLEGLS